MILVHLDNKHLTEDQKAKIREKYGTVRIVEIADQPSIGSMQFVLNMADIIAHDGKLPDELREVLKNKEEFIV